MADAMFGISIAKLKVDHSQVVIPQGLNMLRKNSALRQKRRKSGDRKPSPAANGSFLGHSDALHFRHFLEN
jgi:hypothetical protein